MRPLAVILILFCSGCVAQKIDPLSVRFQQLVQNPERFDGKTVHLTCTMALFGERTMFTASGMPPSFDCDVISLGSRGAWENTAPFVELRSEARRIYDRFRRDHRNLAWPEVEAEIELIARFDMPDHRVARFTFTPVELLAFRLVRIIALADGSPHQSLRSFPISALESAPPQPTPTPPPARSDF